MEEPKPFVYTGPITYEDYCNFIMELKRLGATESAGSTTVEDNMKFLRERQKKLGKPIPDELLVFVFLNRPVGHKFLEKYKEWIE